MPACPPASQPENQKHHHQSRPQPSSVALEEKKRKKRIRPSSQLSPHRPIYLRASSFHVSPLSLMSVPKSSSASFQEVEKLFSTRFGKEWVAQWCCSLLLLYGKYHLNDVMSPFLFFFFLPSSQDNQKTIGIVRFNFPQTPTTTQPSSSSSRGIPILSCLCCFSSMIVIYHLTFLTSVAQPSMPSPLLPTATSTLALPSLK